LAPSLSLSPSIFALSKYWYIFLIIMLSLPYAWNLHY
jgi:hypothetical protein